MQFFIRFNDLDQLLIRGGAKEILHRFLLFLHHARLHIFDLANALYSLLLLLLSVLFELAAGGIEGLKCLVSGRARVFLLWSLIEF